MADSKHYFVRNIDVYQENNMENVDMHARASNIPTTIKAVVNRIIAAGVGNDPDGAIFFLDYCYTCPDLLAILE